MSLEKFPQGLPVYSKFLADIYFSLIPVGGIKPVHT